MGGRALKGKDTFTRRYTRKEFDILWVEMANILTKTFKQFGYPKFYNNKETFGDMDVILSMDGFNQNMRDYIEETFKPNEIFHNGNAWSFDYKELQIDFITCSPDDYDSLHNYMKYNDLGNLIGRVAQHIGVKYGQEGLFYNHFIDGQKVGKVILSKDDRKIYDFLGLDYDRCLSGFDELEDIFNFIRSSKYYNPHYFSLDNLNKINRDRNLKRKTYMSFLEYIKNDKPNENYNYIDIRLINENLITILERDFPESNINLEIKRFEYEYAKSKYVSTKFSGRHIMEKYGLTGKELGDAITKFKNYVSVISDMEYNDFICNFDIDYLYKSFEQANEND